MKNIIMMTLVASVAMVLCVSNKAMAAVPDGYKTHELTNYRVSLPAEFVKSDGWSSENNLSFNSNAVNVRDDGDEYLSSANINVYEMEGNIEELNDYAQNMVGSARAMDEICDEPIVEGNTVIVRSKSELDDGYVVYWRYIVINDDGRVAGGTISYYGADAKFYDGIVMPIIESIQFK